MNEIDLKNLIQNLKISYHSGHGDKLYKDFYSPLLSKANLYVRETGDFTTNVIFDWGEGLSNALKRKPGECLIKIIANPKLQENDRNTLLEVIENRNNKNYLSELQEYISNVAEKTIEKSFAEAKGNSHKEIKLKIFAYLVANKILILKFGKPNHEPNPNMFHPKSGVFTFEDNIKVGFIGGSNETHGGYVTNIEYIHVYNNLIGLNPHLDDIEDKFNTAWEGDAEGFKTVSLKKEFLKKIETYAPSLNKLKEDIKKYNQEHKKTLGENISEENKKKLDDLANKLKIDPLIENPKKENYLDITEEKWGFQKKAREKFILAENGILEMATGTGKTRTALSIVTQLVKDKKINNIIIQLEKDNLISQWEKNIREWLKSETYEDINLLKFAQNKNQLDEFILSLQSNIIQLLIVSKHNLPELLKKINDKDLTKTIMIHDEVHGLFSEKILPEIQGMQKNIKYKLGLSATIENKFDPERTKILFEEIGPIIFEYDLERAIQEGVLVEFDLVRLDYRLLDSDRRKKSKAHRVFHMDIENGVNPKTAEKRRNLKLSAIKKNCVDKVRVFQNNFEKISKYLHRSFIYANEKVYVDKVLNILVHKNINFKKHTDGANYENIKKFSNGEIDCLLNCEKLSEGIDVKSVNNIVLFATPQGIQLIQRLGRVLRIDNNFPNKRACVIDFFEEDDMANEEGSDYNRYKKLKKLSEIKKLI